MKMPLVWLALAGTPLLSVCKARKPDLNTRISVDFSISRHQDPEPFHSLLAGRMKAAGFPYEIIDKPSEMGYVWIQVEDDHLQEAARIFDACLAQPEGHGHQSHITVRP